MTLQCRSLRISQLIALAMILGVNDGVLANWLTLKNETGKPITVQEIVFVNGQVKRGKTTNLLPGETYREFLAIPTVKKVEVFEAQNPNKPVWSGNLSCKDERQTFSVTAPGGRFKVTQIPLPPKK